MTRKNPHAATSTLGGEGKPGYSDLSLAFFM